jgi:multiple sugar transport system ATP-binding protein
MNFIRGTLKEQGEKFRFLEKDSGTIDATFPAGEQSAAREFSGKEMILGIRPEDIEVTKAGQEKTQREGTANFPAIVDIVEPMGAETNLYLQTGAHTLICRSAGALDHREAGHRFQFEMNLRKAHLFDPASGARIR